jgi:hypothetical protein
MKFAIGALALVVSCSSAWAFDEVFRSGDYTGSFTPFDSSTPAGTTFGDGYWLTGPGSDPFTDINSITLFLAAFNSTGDVLPAGSTDLVFTFNDGDPSGLQFGPGTELYSTVVTGVELPFIAVPDSVELFEITIPLPGITLSGNFNNWGFSLGVQNFSYAGEFGFQNSGQFNFLGALTANASEFDPATNSWSLFAFGPAFPADVANFRAVLTVPEPTTLALLAGFGVLALRRRA